MEEGYCGVGLGVVDVEGGGFGGEVGDDGGG